jgi:carotenoid cleavage dioxygenase-like enzyme
MTGREDGKFKPYFVNQFILTDLYLSTVTSPTLRSHIVPSISTLVNPATTLWRLCLTILRTLFIMLLSHLPGSSHKIRRISVTNTGLIYHSGRALATCENGPPIRIQLPELKTVGWYNGSFAEGERRQSFDDTRFGANGLLGFMDEWTTGHPKIDPTTGDLILYHCSFIAPYVHYSIILSEDTADTMRQRSQRQQLTRLPVPGVSGARMMHDFGVSLRHTVLMDLPLSLDPFNLIKSKPVVMYDSTCPARFGVFARDDPSTIRWFETDSCCIFHTANTWDEINLEGHCSSVNFLVCRLTSPATIFVAGNVEVPRIVESIGQHTQNSRPPFFDRYDYDETYVQSKSKDVCVIGTTLADDGFNSAPAWESMTQNVSYAVPEEEQCRLFYYEFDLDRNEYNRVKHQFALSCIPFEFPTVHPAKEMSAAQYIYGCSTSTASFNVALGRAVKIDTIVKVNAIALIARGKQHPHLNRTGSVDSRTISEILQDNMANSEDSIQCFKMPNGWYAQEARLVPRSPAKSEDDGYLLFYAFDESQLNADGSCSDHSASELWVLDAKTMSDVVCRVRLPQRVPYGFHGNFFTGQQISQQREVSSFRTVPERTTGVFRTLQDYMIELVG